MVKVKVICAIRLSTLEAQLNEFLESIDEVIDIKFVNTASNNHDRVTYYAYVIYKISNANTQTNCNGIEFY